jgi:hypothetical protein
VMISGGSSEPFSGLATGDGAANKLFLPKKRVRRAGPNSAS